MRRCEKGHCLVSRGRLSGVFDVHGIRSHICSPRLPEADGRAIRGFQPDDCAILTMMLERRAWPVKFTAHD